MFSLRLTSLIFAASAALAAPAPKMPDVPADCSPQLVFPQPGVKLTLVAEHPQVVTPTGIDVDAQGRVWVAASHTHFRPEGYPGPAHDEIIVLSNFDAGGRAQTRTVFYDKTDDTMGLLLGPEGWVYLAERSRILRVKDTDGDGRGDREETIATLKTEETYPHNGLSGLAWHPSGDLIIALGENMWKTWSFVASDGTTIDGAGEGGIFRSKADGSQMRRIAVGFWNPFGLCVREDGEIFVGENDPGSRPPCRLLHIVEGGDYGYTRDYGEAPFHPFVCWNGELRGTLPMVSPSGEAPCGVQPLGGGLIGGSWTDHRIDFFALQRSGASYTAERIPIVTGGDMFRPTCIARASEGTYYFADWVFGSYPIHQRGRVWKLEIDKQAAREWLKPAAPEPLAPVKTGSTEENFALARGSDPFVARAALLALAKNEGEWSAGVAKFDERDHVSACIALKLAKPKDEALARKFLADAGAEVQFEALRWICEQRLAGLLPQVEAKLREHDLDFSRFEACLAVVNTLTGNARGGVDNRDMLLARVRDTNAPPRVRAYALRLLRPRPGQLTVPVLREMLELKDVTLSLEAVRALAREGSAATETLTSIARAESQPAAVRAEAVAALANSETSSALFLDLASNPDGILREEALRALRLTALGDEQKTKLRGVAKQFSASADLVAAILDPSASAMNRPAPHDLAAWQKLLARVPGKPDVEAGRRIFFHPKLSQCANCHLHSGRGNVVGPDMSVVGDRGDDAWLLQAILDPSRDVAPQFYPLSLEMKDGSGFVGFLLRDGGGATAVYRDLTGAERSIKRGDIVKREELKTSVMPPGLLALLTDREVRDLLAFLRARTH